MCTGFPLQKYNFFLDNQTIYQSFYISSILNPELLKIIVFTLGYGTLSKALSNSACISFTLLDDILPRKYLKTEYIPNKLFFWFPKYPNGPSLIASSKFKSNRTLP